MAPEAAPPAGPPRQRARLTSEERRRQLVSAAIPVAARSGLGNLALDVVSARVGVTRNLLYHYFPRGRRDLEIAVVAEAERQLGLAEAQVDPLPRMLEHALAPTHAWRIHRWAEASSDPEIREIAASTVHQIVLALSRHELSPGEPGPLLATALRGFVAFAETALDSGRAMSLPRPALSALLNRTLTATLDAARG
jgi:AcrR family transcriptional regulator